MFERVTSLKDKRLTIKDYNVMIDGRNVFDQPVENDLRTYNIRKVKTG